MSTIVLNTFVFRLCWNRQPEEMVYFLSVLNWIFLAVFTMEAVLKLLAYGLSYFNDGWNLFDFIVITLTWIGKISLNKD